MNCQSLAVQASLLQKVRGYGGEVYYSNKTNKGLPRSCLSMCKYRAFEMNISEDRGMVLGGSSSPSGWELGVKCGASLHLPPQHHLCSPPATSHLRSPEPPACPKGQCLLLETLWGGFAGARGLHAQTLCYVEWSGLMYLGLNIYISFPA